MVRRGFPFSHIQLSFAQWLAARTTIMHPETVPVVLATRESRFDQPSGIGAFKPKILSMIQPTTILQGHRWENYRVVGASDTDILNSSSPPHQNGADDTENSNSSSLSIEDMQMFVNRRTNQREENTDNDASISSGNTLSSLSSLLSEEGIDASDFTNSQFVLGDPMGGQDRYFARINAPRVTLPVMPPPYPYPEEPPPTYEEAMLSNNPNIDRLTAEEVAITLAELDSVLSAYPAAHDSADWVYDLPTSASGQRSQSLLNYDPENWDQTVYLQARPAGQLQTVFSEELPREDAQNCESEASPAERSLGTSQNLNVRPVESAQRTESENWSLENAQNAQLESIHVYSAQNQCTMSQGVQTDGTLLLGVTLSDLHDIVSQSAQNSNRSAQNSDSVQSDDDSNLRDERLTCDPWTEVTSDTTSCDYHNMSSSAVHTYSTDASFTFQEQLPTSYQLSNSRDLLY